jgi:hypothetical protein
VPQSILELLEQSRKLIEQSRALREAVKETKSDSIRAVAHAKAIRDSMIEQEKHKRNRISRR